MKYKMIVVTAEEFHRVLDHRPRDLTREVWLNRRNLTQETHYSEIWMGPNGLDARVVAISTEDVGSEEESPIYMVREDALSADMARGLDLYPFQPKRAIRIASAAPTFLSTARNFARNGTLLGMSSMQ